jgi:hypothetical protein
MEGAMTDIGTTMNLKITYGARLWLDDFVRVPTLRQQAVTLALAGAVMGVISVISAYFDLI